MAIPAFKINYLKNDSFVFIVLKINKKCCLWLQKMSNYRLWCLEIIEMLILDFKITKILFCGFRNYGKMYLLLPKPKRKNNIFVFITLKFNNKYRLYSQS